jgi:hypothetical protein
VKTPTRLWRPLLVWALTRGAVIAVWLTAEQVLGGDVAYYYDRLHRMMSLGVPVAQTMPEYPTPVLWLLMVPYLFSGQTLEGFRIAFVAIMVALDLAFTITLWHRGQGRTAVWFWIAFIVAIGPISYLRLDLIPAVACGLALVALSRGADRFAGVLLAVGAGLKLWPGTLWPTTVRGVRRRDHLVTVSFFVTGVALVVAAVIQGGVARLLSPLQWQSGRGLQIESVWATPSMVARIFDPQAYRIEYSRWQAYEVFGPGVDGWLTFSTVATTVGYALILGGYVLWFRARYPDVFTRHPRLVNAAVPASPAAVGLFMVVLITITLITNKTFSPQYLTWMGAPLAALLLVADPSQRWLRRTASVAAIMVLGLAVATQLVYPAGYEELLGHQGQPGLVTGVLVVRNLGLVVLGVWLMSRFWPVLRGRVEHSTAP